MPASPQCAADMLFHLARSASHPGGDTALTAAQWAALRFFARASRPSRTPSGFARFHATTRGTASQTVKSLEQLGYLARASSARDGRSVIFEVTEAGCHCLANDPLRVLEAALEKLPTNDVRRLCDVLQSSMVAVAGNQDEPVLGTCSDCGSLTGGGEGGAAFPVCGRSGERLETSDFERLCVQFSPGPSGFDEAGLDGPLESP